MTKRELATLIDDRVYLPEYRRGLGYRQLMRRSKTQLWEQYADLHLTREQRRASADRSWQAYLARSGRG